MLPEDAVAVINMDDPRGQDMTFVATARWATAVARGPWRRGRLRILGQRFDATGQDVRLSWQGQPHQVRLNLIGGFQAGNAALAAGLCIAAGGD